MARANSNIQMTGLDFDEIKSNLKTFLKSQNVIKDANYEGSVLSVLLDILAYNTHYQAYYLNMVANEMFLDTAQKRSSVISHAKLLGYTPSSYAAPRALINITFTNVTSSSIILPKYTKFLTSSVDNINYVFVTTKEYILIPDQTTQLATLENVELVQGEPIAISFIYNENINPNAIFKLPDKRIDISTLSVIVQNSTTDVNINLYTPPTDMLLLNENDQVYFTQESFDGFYEIYFGNGILGKKLVNGNVIYVTYLSVADTLVSGNVNFSLISTPIADYNSVIIELVSPAGQGQEKESIESIRYIAPKSYSAQERAVTINDYITLIQKNSTLFPFDAVNVWSGEENSPPIYGKVFIALKPKGGYTITQNQKKRITTEIIEPISVQTIKPEIVDTEYTYLNLIIDVLYNINKTFLTEEQIKSTIKSAIYNFAALNLNTFNSTFVYADLITTINNCENSIITNEPKVYLEKKFIPNLKTPETYIIDYGIPLKRDFFRKSVSISPSIQYVDESNNITINNVYIEEVPTTSTSIASIEVINPGFGYTDIPTISILGDGIGATATATIINNKIATIDITNPGTNYTQAIVTITGGNGLLGSAKAVLQGQYGTLRSYYFQNGVKYILDSNIGTIDYYNGIITLTNFNPLNVNNPLAILSIKAIPDTNIIYSKYNKMLTLNQDDSSAISITLKTK